MARESIHKIRRQLIVSTEIMKSANISLDQLQESANYLGRVLGARARNIIPDRINDVLTLGWIINLSDSLKKLQDLEGFEKHIGRYTKSQIQSTYFVTVLATYILDKRVDGVALEPQVPGTGKKSDILVRLQGEEVYLECKTVHTDQFNYAEEHNHILSILQNYIKIPHQVDIRYRKSLSDLELHGLGKTLEQRLAQVKGNGKIVDNENIEVGVQVREEYQAQTPKIVLWGHSENLHEKCIYPLHCYGINGHTISIAGPKVDYSEILRSKIRKSRRQSPDDNPYVLSINGNLMLGSLTENIRAVSSAFQPQMNTRFSAAILATFYQPLARPGIDYKFYFVSNPFAKFPVTCRFGSLFSSYPEV